MNKENLFEMANRATTQKFLKVKPFSNQKKTSKICFFHSLNFSGQIHFKCFFQQAIVNQVQSEKFHKGIEKSNISNKIRKKRLELWVDYIRQI